MSEALRASQSLLGISPELHERALRGLVAALRADFESIVERGAELTVGLPGYEGRTIDEVRPNTRRAMGALVDALAAGDFGDFAGHFHDVVYQRARQGCRSRRSSRSRTSPSGSSGRPWSWRSTTPRSGSPPSR
ncbi:MAG: hypothetical protein R3B09_07010 [Nannocystaceae bacterium]